MLLENYIRELLLEAPQVKLGELMKHPGKVLLGKDYKSYWELANEEFRTFYANEDLSKRGPFFNCIKLCFDEFLSFENDPEFDVAEHIREMIIYINGLYDFKSNENVAPVYNKFIADGYNGFEELKQAYESIYEFTKHKNLNSFNNPSYISLIKSSQTQYLFDTPDHTLNGLLCVVPTTTSASIFWARTNADAQQIILTKLDRSKYGKDPDFLSWCTSFPDNSNMFNSYFMRGGTTLFYFLPVNDPQGVNKFCIGVTKVSRKNKDKDYLLICGGHTTVGFENKSFLSTSSNFEDNRIQQTILDKFGPLGLTKEMLDVIIEKVSGRNPFDKYAYIGGLNSAEFAAGVNMNTIGTTKDGRNSIKNQIEMTLDVYKDPEFLKQYTPNPKIIAIIDKDFRYFTECGVSPNYINPEAFNKNLKPAEFAARIDMNTVGQTKEGRALIKNQIETILSIYKIYKDPKFLKFEPNPEIMEIIRSDVRYFTECGVSLEFMDPKYFKNYLNDFDNFWDPYLESQLENISEYRLSARDFLKALDPSSNGLNFNLYKKIMDKVIDVYKNNDNDDDLDDDDYDDDDEYDYSEGGQVGNEYVSGLSKFFAFIPLADKLKADTNELKQFLNYQMQFNKRLDNEDYAFSILDDLTRSNEKIPMATFQAMTQELLLKLFSNFSEFSKFLQEVDDSLPMISLIRTDYRNFLIPSEWMEQASFKQYLTSIINENPFKFERWGRSKWDFIEKFLNNFFGILSSSDYKNDFTDFYNKNPEFVHHALPVLLTNRYFSIRLKEVFGNIPFEILEKSSQKDTQPGIFKKLSSIIRQERKYILGNKVLTESQLRKLISHLL